MPDYLSDDQRRIRARELTNIVAEQHSNNIPFPPKTLGELESDIYLLLWLQNKPFKSSSPFNTSIDQYQTIGRMIRE